jgi:hypothetical protein
MEQVSPVIILILAFVVAIFLVKYWKTVLCLIATCMVALTVLGLIALVFILNGRWS